jgi:hypothetical protein
MNNILNICFIIACVIMVVGITYTLIEMAKPFPKNTK